MKLERSNVEFPLWRKKVDKSIFEHNGTIIPAWACQMWNVDTLYADVSSKKDEQSKVFVSFQQETFHGWVTSARKGRKTPAYRLWYEEDLTINLKNTFLMSYMRSLEQGLYEQGRLDIEDEIPFWEFLDIEFDKLNREFRFVAYYTSDVTFIQPPSQGWGALHPRGVRRVPAVLVRATGCGVSRLTVPLLVIRTKTIAFYTESYSKV